MNGHSKESSVRRVPNDLAVDSEIEARVEKFFVGEKSNHEPHATREGRQRPNKNRCMAVNGFEDDGRRDIFEHDDIVGKPRGVDKSLVLAYSGRLQFLETRINDKGGGQ